MNMCWHCQHDLVLSPKRINAYTKQGKEFRACKRDPAHRLADIQSASAAEPHKATLGYGASCARAKGLSYRPGCMVEQGLKAPARPLETFGTQNFNI